MSMAQRMLDSQTDFNRNLNNPSENGDSSKNLAALKPDALDDSDRTNEKIPDGSPIDGKGNMNDLVKNLDQSHLMAIQELMVDMTLEERQNFMSSIQSQVSNEGRLDADVFYRQG